MSIRPSAGRPRPPLICACNCPKSTWGRTKRPVYRETLQQWPDMISHRDPKPERETTPGTFFPPLCPICPFLSLSPSHLSPQYFCYSDYYTEVHRMFEKWWRRLSVNWLVCRRCLCPVAAPSRFGLHTSCHGDMTCWKVTLKTEGWSQSYPANLQILPLTTDPRNAKIILIIVCADGAGVHLNILSLGWLLSQEVYMKVLGLLELGDKPLHSISAFPLTLTHGLSVWVLSQTLSHLSDISKSS